MALNFKQIARGKICKMSQPHFEQLIPVDTDEPTSYTGKWNVSRTANDSVRAYLIGNANYELHFYGYGATANYGRTSTSPYYTAPWANYTSQINKIVYHDGITDIGQLNFFGKITPYTSPATLKRITLEISDTVRALQRYAIYYAPLDNVDLGNGIRKLGEGCLYAGFNGQTLSFPYLQIANYSAINGYQTVYDWLKYHTNDNSYLIDGDGVLLWGKPIGTVWNFPEGVKSVNCFPWDNRTSVTSVTLPSTTKYIAFGAFSGFSALTSMNLPNGTERIYGFSFQNCSGLRKVWISRSVKHILTDTIVTSTGATTDTAYPFTGCTNLTIYCEIDSSEIPEGWSQYWNYKASGSIVPVVWNVTESAFNEM